LIGAKDRDVKTGNITRTSITPIVHGGNAIIVDDICDGGRTFIELAKCLKPACDKVYLYVTHGIFSKGLDVFDGLIDHIWTANSFLTETDPRLTVIRRKDV